MVEEESNRSPFEFEEEEMRKGFTSFPNAVLHNKSLSQCAKMVYVSLLSFAWQDDNCFPGIETLAEVASCSVNSAMRALKELKGHGLISVQRRGLGKTNVYTIMRIKKSPEGDHCSPTQGDQEPPHRETNNTQKREDAEEEYFNGNAVEKTRHQEIFNALVRECNISTPIPQQAAARIGRTAKGLVATGATEEEVAVRAAHYRKKYRGMPCTPNALANHWGELAVGAEMEEFVNG